MEKETKENLESRLEKSVDLAEADRINQMLLTMELIDFIKKIPRNM